MYGNIWAVIKSSLAFTTLALFCFFLSTLQQAQGSELQEVAAELQRDRSGFLMPKGFTCVQGIPVADLGWAVDSEEPATIHMVRCKDRGPPPSLPNQGNKKPLVQLKRAALRGELHVGHCSSIVRLVDAGL